MGSYNTCYLSFFLPIALLFSYNIDTLHAACNLNLMPQQTFPCLTEPKVNPLPEEPLPVPEVPKVGPLPKDSLLKDLMLPTQPKDPDVPNLSKPKVLPILPKPEHLPKLPFNPFHFPLFPFSSITNSCASLSYWSQNTMKALGFKGALCMVLPHGRQCSRAL